MPVASKSNEFCCGISEIGNFNYVKDRGPKGAPHYHRPKGGGWKSVRAADPTTEEEVRQVVKPLTQRSGAVICTTGADQEYMDEILTRIGFVCHEFKNRVHEQGLVKFWFLASTDYKEPAPEAKK